MITATSANFRQHYAKYKIEAHHEPILITNHGNEEFVFMSVKEYRRLQAQRQFLPAEEMPDEWGDALKQVDTTHMEQFNHER